MVGREEEIEKMNLLLNSNESEFLAVLGRRRVGKTYLIREVYKTSMMFEFVGTQNESSAVQLSNFVFELRKTFDNELITNGISTWQEAFQSLTLCIEQNRGDKKPVIFIDELPWVAGRKASFLNAFEYFWNSWASKNNVIVVICGSAASWIIKNVINNKGGLHNRVTQQLYIQPFTCAETKQYIIERGLKYNDEQITELYMALGGIPFYLKLIRKGLSVPQAINDLMFKEKAPLRSEFENLYKALFSQPENHIAVIKACYSKWKGVSQSEIVALSQKASGGTLSKILQELELSGFIQSQKPFSNSKKETLYRLTDEFSIFYLKFMDGQKNVDFNIIRQSQAFKIWQGFAFENFCFKHMPKIKEKLGIAGIISNQYSYIIKADANHTGSQIDMIIDRNDQTVNICEIKYTDKPLNISQQYGQLLQERIEKFRQNTGTKKTVFLTMISKSGIGNMAYEGHIIDNQVIVSDFYK